MIEYSPGGFLCSQVLARLSDFLDGDLAPAERLAVEAHVRECVRCAQFGGAVAVVLQGLRQQLRAETPIGLDAGAAARLAEALRRAR